MAPEKDPLLDRLHTQLRRQGQSPERDLWPGINEAISAEEKRLLQRSPRGAARFWQPKQRALAAAVVAFALLVMPGVFKPFEDDPVADSQQQVVVAEAGLPPSGMARSANSLAEAIADLEKAAGEHPNDQNLSRLVRMVHSRQGEFVRQRWSENTRIQNMMNGGVS